MRYYRIIPVLLAFALVAPTAFAKNDDGERPAKQLKMLDKAIERLEKFEFPLVDSEADHPTQLVVNASGNVRIIAGEVTAVSGSSLTVKSWGLSLTVNAGSASFLPSGTTIANISVGSRVNVSGNIDSATGVITARTVRVRSPLPALSDQLFQRIIELITRIREIQARLGLPLTPLPTPPGTPPPPADTTAPVLSSITADNIASTTARVRWNTNESADGRVWYSTVSPVAIASTTQTVFSSSLVTSHEANLSGLVASTTHYYLVVSKDGAGNTATSSQFSFITLP